jgi:transcription initiation factor IIE alpha subunit
MNLERELDIGRQMGGNVFYVYNILKSIGGVSTNKDIQLESGMDEKTLRKILRNLEDAGVVKVDLIATNRAQYRYRFSVNEQDKWKLH